LLSIIIITFIFVSISLVLYFSKRAKALEKQVSILENTFQNADTAILIIDNNTKIVYSNESFQSMLVSHKSIFSDEKILELENEESISLITLIENHKKNINKNFASRIHAKLLNSDNTLPIEIHFNSFVENQTKNTLYTTLMIYDKSKGLNTVELSRENFLLALPNQNQAFIDINKIILRNEEFALLLVNIDDFFKVQGILGQSATHVLIKKILAYLKSFLLQVNGRLYSVASDTFLIQIPEINMPEEAEGIAEKIKHDIQMMIDVESIPIDISISIGANFFPFYGNGSSMLLDNTYTALLKAKEQGKGLIYVEKNMSNNDDKSNELKFYNEVKIAIDEEQFEIYYQPLFDLKTGLISEAEALLRWNHPLRGLISGEECISVAKKTGLIVKLGQSIISKIIKQQKKWEIYNFPRIQISINVTLKEIETGELLGFIEAELSKNKIHPKLIKLEIPEDIAMTNTSTARSEFLALQKLGISLGLDNFGKGHSSFAYLKTLPINSIHIDRMFMSDLVSNKEHQKIVKAIIALGHNFGLKVLAGGIEDKQTYELLKSYQCDIVQGYYFSIPLPLSDFQHLLRQKTDIASMIALSSH